MQIRRSIHQTVLVAIAAFGLFTASALAHHGWGGYSDKDLDLTGVVAKPVSLAGPHATMQITVEKQLWDVTLAPPARTSQAGLREATIPVGARVTVHGHRHMDPKKFEIKTERVTYNGKVYNVYPDRE